MSFTVRSESLEDDIEISQIEIIQVGTFCRDICLRLDQEVVNSLDYQFFPTELEIPLISPDELEEGILGEVLMELF